MSAALLSPLADALPVPVVVVGGGVLLAGLFIAAAVIIVGIMFIRRRGRNKQG
jgi:hypothetical protein